MSNSVKTIIIIVTAVFLIAVLGVMAIIGFFVPVRTVQTFESNSTEVNNLELTKSIVDQIFPGSQYTIKDGKIDFSSQIQANYQTLYLEQLSFGHFMDSADEYVAVLRAPEEVTVHAGGLYYAVAAVFDSNTNKLKSQVQQFMNDDGQIDVLKGKAQDYILYLGSTTYQGWTESQGALYDVSSGQWGKTWPLEQDFFKDRYAVYGNNRLVLYKRVIELHNNESAVPPNHFDLDKQLIWSSEMESFREPEAWE